MLDIVPWFTGDSDNQSEASAAVARAWETTDPPHGLVSAHCFASVGGESILLYMQWEGEQALRNVDGDVNALTGNVGVQPFGYRNAPAYRLYRSLGGTSTSVAPTRLICAFFDTDGPERQRHIAAALIQLSDDLPENPAALSSHFHLSLNGTRVINYNEWSDTGSHDVHADEGAYDEIYRVSTSTPGVRSLKGNDYRHVADYVNAVRRP